ncbi:putative mitochondrial serine peptidase clan SC, family S9A [Leptomonas pyrrhocoris]|uniref:Prolyl endopeptidase n=1 Tax=Leptomonas pyrrhocoris TaxID=157538 RepID=A0A0N0DR06_LEPPY|nr:putative mitochondrial serine peptidase clan SC, family S9A [Leptomonas pyrrhocoris]KPA73791.1 putative mitochondrial serine peptidase clan SC, family S9A [Leptomonas pyrrhocoris]|eukprot:XP_015652230.1 putative mitochondrial serine peptidase clan SC, family S9A [Leptomonas pyrrhocoris]
MRTAVADPSKTEVFMDMNTMSADGTSALLTSAWSDDDRFFAYSVCDKGSDWQHLHVRDAITLTNLDDRVEWAKFTDITWWGHVGFFYMRFAALHDGVEQGAETDCAENSFLCFHRVGTPQTDDVVVIPADPAHSQWSYHAKVSDDARYLVVEVHDGCEPHNTVWVAPLPAEVADLAAAKMTFTKLVAVMQHRYEFIGNDGDVFYFTTTKDAPNRQIISVDVRDPGESVTVVVVPERPSVLSEVVLARDTLFLVYVEDVKDTLYTRALHALDTAAAKIDLPIGSLLSLKANRHKSFVSFKLTSFLMPGRVYVTDAENPSEALRVFAEEMVDGLHAEDYVTEQRFYTVADGTRIPMFLTYKKGSASPQSPVLLFGYGGFHNALKPVFSPFRLMFLQNMNGVLAIPNIRGGGEYGQAWHDAGRRANKHNCFSDFIAAAAFLHDAGIGSVATTAAMGRSNGGLLMGAVANRAPERFGCVVCQVGVLDMFKFHKYTIGAAWISDFGNPDVKDDFAVVQAYSPLHNIRAGVQYPAILVVTGDHNDRVVPLHSLKYIATLQHSNPDVGGPFVTRIDEAGGHGQGKPISKLIREEADIYAFIAKSLKVTWVDA